MILYLQHHIFLVKVSLIEVINLLYRVLYITVTSSFNIDLRVGFARSQYVFSESDGQAAIEIVLTGETVNGSVNVIVSGGWI